MIDTFFHLSGYQRRTICLCFALLLITILSACAFTKEDTVQKDPDGKLFKSLLHLNDMNEKAFEYHQLCLRKKEPMDEVFMQNYEIVANLLLDEAMRTTEHEPEYIVSQILKRRKRIQRLLNNHYHTKGCYSEEAVSAQEHYQTFSQLSKEQIETLINPLDIRPVTEPIKNKW